MNHGSLYTSMTWKWPLQSALVIDRRLKIENCSQLLVYRCVQCLVWRAIQRKIHYLVSPQCTHTTNDRQIYWQLFQLFLPTEQ